MRRTTGKRWDSCSKRWSSEGKNDKKEEKLVVSTGGISARGPVQVEGELVGSMRPQGGGAEVSAAEIWAAGGQVCYAEIFIAEVWADRSQVCRPEVWVDGSRICRQEISTGIGSDTGCSGI